jgi:hypothetical protein
LEEAPVYYVGLNYHKRYTQLQLKDEGGRIGDLPLFFRLDLPEVGQWMLKKEVGSLSIPFFVG